MQSRTRLRALWPFAPYVLVSAIHVIANATHSALTAPTKTDAFATQARTDAADREALA